MNRTWIIGDGDKARWHVANRRTSEYGTTSYVPICSGRPLYSPWGIASRFCERPSEIEHAVCKKCEAALAKEIA
jgi:hypothetical protein